MSTIKSKDKDGEKIVIMTLKKSLDGDNIAGLVDLLIKSFNKCKIIMELNLDECVFFLLTQK